MSEKAFDYKQAYRDLYLPKDRPALIQVPAIHFIMADGSGDPNHDAGFEQAVELLYGLSFTIKMSKMKLNRPEGYFDYLVPPLEGLWWIEDGGFSFEKRENWRWTLMIRQPEFVTEGVFRLAGAELGAKKPGLAVERARFEAFEEGWCVQMMHIGPYSTEPETIQKITAFIQAEGLQSRIGPNAKHHEIYRSDPRKSNPERMKTVLRHPVILPAR